MQDKAVYLLVVEGFADGSQPTRWPNCDDMATIRVESIGLTAAPGPVNGGLQGVALKDCV
jgi:hypothetical protein